MNVLPGAVVSKQGKRKLHHGPVPRPRAGSADASSVCFHDGPADRQSDPRTSIPAVPSSISAVEAFEDVRQLGRGDPVSVIGHGEVNLAALSTAAHGHPAASRAVLQSVVQKVAEDLAEPVGVSSDYARERGQFKVQIHTAAAVGVLRRVRRSTHQASDFDALDL